MTQHRRPRQLLNEIINSNHLDDDTLTEICINLGWEDREIEEVCKIDSYHIKCHKVDSGDYEWADEREETIREVNEANAY